MAGEVQRAIGVVSSKDYAAHRGVSAAYISKLKRLGKLAAPAVLPDGRINVALADQMLGDVQQLLEMAASEVAPRALSGPSYQAERALREAALREQEQIALAREKQQIRHAKEVDRDTFEAFRLTRDELLALPPRLAEDLAAESAPRAITHMLNKALVAVLADLSRRLGADAAEPEERKEDERGA
ncbi:hypothetical protein [Pseudoroseomonas cervicalis]|uniref:hypothetical protein n=1 Tax=Teichococcus cervicalis TaxID=204525 RepID=UPI002781B6C6|nr:hypothetical protein [Pseudoroseomonas cervicalis]MDQ1079704.1 hypothetical protein [Pseudoroseomonas cervicalis]